LNPAGFEQIVNFEVSNVNSYNGTTPT
jgi:hypothetical protein